MTHEALLLFLMFVAVLAPAYVIFHFFGCDLRFLVPWVLPPAFIICIIAGFWAARNRALYGADFWGGYRMIWIEIRLLFSLAFGPKKPTSDGEQRDDGS